MYNHGAILGTVGFFIFGTIAAVDYYNESRMMMFWMIFALFFLGVFIINGVKER